MTFLVLCFLYGPTHIHILLLEKKTSLTIWTFVGKVMSLLFNMLSMFVIVFLPGSKCLVISWLQLPSAVILEPRTIKSVTVSIVSPSIYYEVMGLDAIIIALILGLCFLFKNCKYESFQLYSQATEAQKSHS